MRAEPAGAGLTPGDEADSGLLTLSSVHKRYGDRVVLTGASLALPAGAVTWLGGRNGAGKTTLLRVASGLIAPDRGTVRLDGLDPERRRRAFQRRVGFLSAGNGGLYARLSVRDNLDLWAALALVPRRGRRASVDRALTRFGLEELAGRRSDRLSTGQRQRIRIAMAFLHDPDVVLLDEPHTSLDEEGLDVLRAALAETVARGGAALWCSPGPDKDVLPADRRLEIDAGRVAPSEPVPH